MTDYNELLRDCVAEFRPNKRPSRPAKPTDNAPAPERMEAGRIAEPLEHEPLEDWGPPLPRQPRAKKPSRLFLILAFLVSLAPAPVIPALLVIPFAAGLVVFVWLVATSGWQFR